MRVNKTDRDDARGFAELARPSWSTFDEMSRTRCAVCSKAGIKALFEKIVVIMREAPHLRTLFNPMMLAHSALVTQLEFYDVQILKLAKGDEMPRGLMTVPGVGETTS